MLDSTIIRVDKGIVVASVVVGEMDDEAVQSSKATPTTDGLLVVCGDNRGTKP